MEDILPLLWPSCSPQDQAQLVPVLLACAASDPSAACRAAAQHTLQTLPLPLAALCRPLWELHNCTDALLDTPDATVTEAVLAAASPGAATAGAAKRRRVSGSSRKSMESSDNDSSAPAAAAGGGTASASEAERLQEEAADLLRAAGRRGQAKKKVFVSLLGLSAADADAALPRATRMLSEVRGVAAQHAGNSAGDAGVAEGTRKVVWSSAIEAVVPVLEMLQWREVALVQAAAGDADMSAGGALDGGVGRKKKADGVSVSDGEGGAGDGAAAAGRRRPGDAALLLPEADLQQLLAAVQVCPLGGALPRAPRPALLILRA